MLFESQIRDFISCLPWVRLRKSKQALRALIEQRRRIYPEDQAKADSEAIIARLEKMSCFQDAKTVMLYYPIHNEVDLRALLTRYKDQKTFLLPVTHRHSMEVRKYEGELMMKRGHYNVPEPQTSEWRGNIDLIIVPGVVFDPLCNRIGRGGGFYDRFLQTHRRVFKLGVAYDFQVKKHEIPHGRFDKPLNSIVTPTQSIGL